MEVEIEFEEEEDQAAAEAECGISHLPKDLSHLDSLALEQDGEDDDDDVEIDLMDVGTPNSFDGQNHIQRGENRSNSGLGMPVAENGGAETEVEGEGIGLNISGRTTRGMRRGGGGGASGAFSSRTGVSGGIAGGSGAGSPLNADLTDEVDEGGMIVDPASQIRLGEMGMYVDDGGDVIDVDGTVGGKRKR